LPGLLLGRCARLGAGLEDRLGLGEALAVVDVGLALGGWPGGHLLLVTAGGIPVGVRRANALGFEAEAAGHGAANPGTLIACRTCPVRAYSTSCSASWLAQASWPSSVDAPRCGVQRKLSRERSGW